MLQIRFLLSQLDKQVSNEGNMTKTIRRPTSIQLVPLGKQRITHCNDQLGHVIRHTYLHSEFKRIPLPGLWVSWDHIQMATQEGNSPFRTSRGVFQDQVATALHKGHVFDLQWAAIFLIVWLQYFQQMLHSSKKKEQQ